MDAPAEMAGLNRPAPWIVQRSESQLLEACRNGEPAAFEELVRRHERQVYRVAFRMLESRVEAQEMVQEVFVRAYRALPRFRAGARIGTWLYRVTVNACLDSRRRVKTRREVPLDSAVGEAAGEDPAARAAARQLADRVAAALGLLPPRQRATLILRVYEELSLQEIAEVLEAPLGTVKANYHHALVKLRRALEAFQDRRPDPEPHART